MNKLDRLFAERKKNILNIYCTAGYPELNSLTAVIPALQKHGADIIEVGIPYSDPIADGPMIQQSNMQALQRGMTIELLFEQLESLQNEIDIPVVLMGYLNPVLQYGMEKFCRQAAATGVSAIILPDLPMYEYERFYRPLFRKYKLHCIFLISPQTSLGRIKKADALSGGFLYAVSASSTTGTAGPFEGQDDYFEKLQRLQLKNPVLIGFGIKDKNTFSHVCHYAAGAIIGTAYIKAISKSDDIDTATNSFIRQLTQ